MLFLMIRKLPPQEMLIAYNRLLGKYFFFKYQNIRDIFCNQRCEYFTTREVDWTLLYNLGELDSLLSIAFC